jgi:hypothetical protein
MTAKFYRTALSHNCVRNDRATCPLFALAKENADQRAMSDSYIIEVSSQAAGIVVRDRLGYRFFAAAQPYFRLDGRLFRSARDAERAAMQLANSDLTAA